MQNSSSDEENCIQGTSDQHSRYSNFGTNCAPLVADLFLFCYERDFMLSLSDNNQTDIIEAFNSTSRYLDDLLSIDNLVTLNKW